MAEGGVYRQDGSSRAVGLGAAGVFAVIALGGVSTYGASPEVLLTTPIFLMAVYMGADARRSSVVTDARGMTVRGAFRVRRVTWDEVEAVEAREGVPGSWLLRQPTISAVADLRNGETVRLPIPTDGVLDALAEELGRRKPGLRPAGRLRAASGLGQPEGAGPNVPAIRGAFIYAWFTGFLLAVVIGPVLGVVPLVIAAIGWLVYVAIGVLILRWLSRHEPAAAANYTGYESDRR